MCSSDLSFNLEYFLVGGRAARRPDKPFFMWYDWMVGGWGGRHDRDGMGAGPSVFGVGLTMQPIEGQERLCPVLATRHEIAADSGGPGRYRGGPGTEKGVRILDVENCVVSYSCDRARSVTWGIEGGLPSRPHGVWVGAEREGRFLGAAFSGVPLSSNAELFRPSAGGGGFGDPLERDPKAVLEDVIDGYVTPGRAAKDYGVVVTTLDEEIHAFELDLAETAAARAHIRAHRRAWLEEDAESIAARYRAGELDVLDAVRRYGVILDWETGALLKRTTATFRRMFTRRAVRHWRDEVAQSSEEK